MFQILYLYDLFETKHIFTGDTFMQIMLNANSLRNVCHCEKIRSMLKICAGKFYNLPTHFKE